MNHANPFKGEKLKRIRIKHLYSQTELARALKMLSRSSVGRWENNVERPNEENEMKLCEIFKVEKDYFRTV